MLRRNPDGEECFYWDALVGEYASFVGGTTPRSFSPCGTTIDRGTTQLFSYPGRFFPYLNDVSPQIVEGLVVPFFAAGKPLGTIWIVSHDERTFGRLQAHLMEQIAAFCAAAFYLMGLRDSAESANLGLAIQAGALEQANSRAEASLEDASAAIKALHDSNEVKDEFVSLVSHELRTPAATIYGNACILLQRGEKLSDEQVTQSLRDIEHESLRLNQVIQDLLTLARPENGGPNVEPIDVVSILQRTVDEHSRHFSSRKICFAPEGPRMYALGNEDYLDQVARNVIGNAEKYSPSDQPISVSVTSAGEEILIRIADRGPGIPAAELDYVFQPYYRSPTTAKKAPGIGIGLAVSQRLVAAMGGRIWVQAGPEGGAEFDFTLPRLTDET
jgi:signal transduction histidine kinase